MTQKEIRERIKALPQKPGVYIFKDSLDKIIYIGKAKRLRSRVTSYFRQSNLSRNDKIKEIYLTTKTIDFIVVPSEREAMFLEANLIYKHKPKYNVFLTDSHHYPYIRISDDEFPNITITRLKSSNNGEYFGPYTNVKLVRKLIELLQRIFKIRTCTYDLSKVKRECFLYHLKMCSAPCTGKITFKKYQNDLNELRGFLNGETSNVREKLENRMYRLSDLLQFEEAKEIRDVLGLFDELYDKQTVDVTQDYNADIITHSSGYIAVLRIRGGMLLGKLSFEFPGEQMQDFITQFYFSRKKEIPGTIITDSLTEQNRKEFKDQFEYIGPPRNEREKRLVSVAYENIEDEIGFRLNAIKTLKQAKELLGLRKTPELIDGIDISHTQGQYTVASVVVFDKGRPYKDSYRRYRITQLQKPNDFQAIETVIKRRYSKHKLPDLLFIDGGKPQLVAAKKALDYLDLDCEIVGIAKENEEIVFPDQRGKLTLPDDNPVKRLLIAVRNEAHRFAVHYHRVLREKRLRRSKLDDVPGIGPKRKKRLLKAFGSISEIKNANEEELYKIVKDRRALNNILDWIKKQSGGR